MNIALFGGSFNPIHSGHIKIIKAIKNNFEVHKFLLMPTAVSPHKSNDEMTTSEHRFNMCKIACENLDYVEVSDIEIKRQGQSFTYLTINDLKQLFPLDKIYLIIGADMFMSFETWKNYEYILKNVSIIAVPRDDTNYGDMIEYSRILEKYGAECYILRDSVMDVSSSEIRYKLKNKIDVSELINKKVLDYIIDNHIYGCEDFE